tara:strand:- start:3583 stop:4128 length:546 start_codon:yes stop_codon:yes gene_type:complete
MLGSSKMTKPFNHVKYDMYNVPIGWIGVISNNIGLTHCLIDPDINQLTIRMDALINIKDTPKLHSEFIEQSIQNYFSGDSSSLAQINIDIPETSPVFFKAIWDTCKTIPSGQTRSYAWLAETSGNKKAVRAAGQAMKNNKLPLFIPCHRVILSSGKLGNYTSGGTEMKRFLLNLESGGQYE